MAARRYCIAECTKWVTPVTLVTLGAQGGSYCTDHVVISRVDSSPHMHDNLDGCVSGLRVVARGFMPRRGWVGSGTPPILPGTVLDSAWVIRTRLRVVARGFMPRRSWVGSGTPPKLPGTVLDSAWAIRTRPASLAQPARITLVLNRSIAPN